MSFDRGFVGEHRAPVLFGGSAFSVFNGDRVGSRSERGVAPAGRVGEAIEPIGARRLEMQRPSKRPPKLLGMQRPPKWDVPQNDPGLRGASRHE